jgi:hypothetical protein
MNRNRVNEDKDQTCSSGLHFCSREYLPHYGSAEGGRVVVIKINPQDVVAIPSDYENAKGRCCRYEVLRELNLSNNERYALPVDKIEGAFYPDETSERLAPKPAPDGTQSQFDRPVRIMQIDPSSGRVVQVFESAGEAMTKTGIDSSSISKVIRGERKQAGGYNWDKAPYGELQARDLPGRDTGGEEWLTEDDDYDDSPWWPDDDGR